MYNMAPYSYFHAEMYSNEDNWKKIEHLHCH